MKLNELSAIHEHMRLGSSQLISVLIIVGAVAQLVLTAAKELND